ncbi:MAG TPA: hypothetical protein VNM47_15840 [Terriglobia bacterium]|nr:hypothetical protein [Terriglobia bacterium]
MSAKTMAPPLTASQVVSRMVEMNRRRTEALRNYSSVRSYHLELHGLINKHADMKVKMKYRWPGKKDFTVLSRSGSAFMQKHVFNRLIEAENEASGRSEHQQASITPENYDFELAGYERDDRGAYYILNVTPRFKRKFLFKGNIRVDDQSFAIVRIEGEPATSLSWWTTKVDFVYRYKRVGGFWLPALNETVTHVRIFGRSLLTIKYQDYDFGTNMNAKSPVPVKLLLSDHAPDSELRPPSSSSD